MIMTPALLLPLRLIDNANINNSFDGNYANNLLKDWQNPACYFQKWELSDTLTLQLISDEALTDLQILNLDGSIADTVQWTVNSLVLPDYPDYLIYEISYPIANLSEGKYVIQQDLFESEGIWVAQDWDKTVLITYKHSINDYDVVFDTGIIFQFRVEGWIGNYKPKNERDVYNDQTRNLTQLNSVAYRQFTFYVGYGFGVPNWIADKVNIITQCDQLQVDGVDYQLIQDSEFEVENNNDNNFIGGFIDIEPKFNNFNKFVTSGTPTNPTIQPVLRVNTYLNQGANFNINGVFKFNSVLWLITLYKLSVDPITLNFGVTPGGSEIGSMTLATLENTLQVDYPFTTATTVYVSGFTAGDDVSIFFAYLQLDAPAVPINPTPSTAEELGKRAVILWSGEDDADFLANWDITTGLGVANTKWTKWAILGSNGTIDPKDAYFKHVGFSQLVDNYTTLNSILGDNQKLIPRESLPNEGLLLVSADVNNVGGQTPTPTDRIAYARSEGSQVLNYQLKRGASPATLGLSEPMGEGAEFDVTPKTAIMLYIIKLVD